MDVQNKWKLELGRMVTLCMQEAAEYERGRSLQVLQPSLAGLLQSSAANIANLQQPGRSGAVAAPPKANGVITPQRDGKRGGAAGSSTSTAAAAADGLGSSVTSIKQEQPAPACSAQQQTLAIAAPTSQADPAATLPFCTPLAGASGAQQAAVIPMPVPASAAAAFTPAVVLGGGMSSHSMAMARMSLQQSQTATANTTHAADTAVAAATPHQGHLAVAGLANVDPAAAITPALLLPGVNTPLMQQVLIQQRFQQQQHWQAASSANPSKEPASKEAVITTTQPNARKGKRRGYCIQPEALKRLVAQQMQKKQRRPEQQHEQQEPEQEHDQQAQPATSLQNQQLAARLHPQQQHRQRSMPRVVHDGTSASAFAGITEDSPGSTVAALMPLQLPMLESPGTALGISMTCAEELDQPSVQFELDASKLFGSAQKRLRLSICDEVNGSAAPQVQHLDLQLSQALTSPVAVPAVTAARDAVAAAAAAADMPATSAAAASVELPLPPQGLVTPSKFFASSPGSAAGGAAVAAAGIPQPAFATPSKFFDGSPVSAGKVRPAHATPATPLLFGHGSASPWPKQLVMDVQPTAAPAAAATSNSLLRSSTAVHAAAGGSNSKAASGVAAGTAPTSSWVPVDGHNRLSLPAAADAAMYAATPAGPAVKVGLMSTPMASTTGNVTDMGRLDAAAAAAAPVETLPAKRSAIAGDAETAGDNAAAAGSVALETPSVTQQQLQATPVTGL